MIGKDTYVKGIINSQGILRIDGTIEGEIHHDGDIVIGETGTVTAQVYARHVTIAGRLEGNVQASGRLELLATGKLHGDIKAAKLVIAEGGFFEGSSVVWNEIDQNTDGRS